MTLLTPHTRYGLYPIENGEIAGPVSIFP